MIWHTMHAKPAQVYSPISMCSSYIQGTGNEVDAPAEKVVVCFLQSMQITAFVM